MPKNQKSRADRPRASSGDVSATLQEERRSRALALVERLIERRAITADEYRCLREAIDSRAEWEWILEVELPMFARTTHPNGRSKHWSIKAESVKLQRENAYWSARVKVGEPWTKDKLTEARIEFEFVVARRHDADNLLAWCKPSIDGFVDYGILSDDRYVEVFACQRLAKKGETAHVVARIGKKKSSLASP